MSISTARSEGGRRSEVSTNIPSGELCSWIYCIISANGVESQGITGRDGSCALPAMSINHQLAITMK